MIVADFGQVEDYVIFAWFYIYISQLIITCLKSTTETLEKDVKYVQS